MKTRAFFLSFLFGFSSISASADSGQFCTQTFNVYGPAYASRIGWRLHRLAKEIMANPCAANQFQEFWRVGDYRPFREQLEPARFAFVRADEIRADSSIIGLVSGFHGHVLGAKSELFRVNNEDGILDWIRNLSGVQKGYTLLDVKLDHGPRAMFVNVHTHPASEAIRVTQIFQLVEAVLATETNVPVILTGDLNAVPTGPELSLLTDVLQLRDTYAEAHGGYRAECTYCGDNPLSWSSDDRVIDFVLARNAPGTSLEVKSSRINFRGSVRDPLSDHFGVRTEFAWNDHAEDQLELKDPLVQARVEKALAALQKARLALRGFTGEGFRLSARRIQALYTQIEAGNFPLGFAQAVRTR